MTSLQPSPPAQRKANLRASKRLQEASKGGASHTCATSPQPLPPAQHKANPQASTKESMAQMASGSKAKVCPPPSLPSPPSPESEEDNNLEDSNQPKVGSMKVRPPWGVVAMKVRPPRGVVAMKVGPPWGVTSTKVGPPRGSVPHVSVNMPTATPQCWSEEGWDSPDTEEAQAHRALWSPPPTSREHNRISPSRCIYSDMRSLFRNCLTLAPPGVH